MVSLFDAHRDEIAKWADQCQAEIRSTDLNHDDIVGPLITEAWHLANFDEAFDYLFVDEAGQVSVGNLVAMGLAARNIVLLGDQMQLSQPSQVTHPGQSGRSVLEFLLDDQATIPPERGVFLGTTWRMHEDVCRFISDAIYEGRLSPEAKNANQRICLNKAPHPALRPTGISFVDVEHTGCTQRSDEEATVVRELFESLLEQGFRDRDGDEYAMSVDDILILCAGQTNRLHRGIKAD